MPQRTQVLLWRREVCFICKTLCVNYIPGRLEFHIGSKNSWKVGAFRKEYCPDLNWSLHKSKPKYIVFIPQHIVEILWLYRQSDFTWNHILLNWKGQKTVLKALNFRFFGKIHIWKLPKCPKIKIQRYQNDQNGSFANTKISIIDFT